MALQAGGPGKASAAAGARRQLEAEFPKLLQNTVCFTQGLQASCSLFLTLSSQDI